MNLELIYTYGAAAIMTTFLLVLAFAAAVSRE
jgi:hypothetical protein